MVSMKSDNFNRLITLKSEPIKRRDFHCNKLSLCVPIRPRFSRLDNFKDCWNKFKLLQKIIVVTSVTRAHFKFNWKH